MNVDLDIRQPSIVANIAQPSLSLDIAQPSYVFFSQLNAAPTVTVGADQSTTSTATVSAIVDYGNPTATILWTAAAGSLGGVATFDDDTAESPVVTFSLSGTYVLRCTATNAGGSDYDELTVTVELSESYIFGSARYGQYRFHADTLTLATGISQVLDESGRGNHLTQSTPSNQPQFVSSGGYGGAGFLRMPSSPSHGFLSRYGSIAGAPATAGVSSVFVVARRYQVTGGQNRAFTVRKWSGAEPVQLHSVGSNPTPAQWFTETPSARSIALSNGTWGVFSRYTTASKTAFALNGVDGFVFSRILHPAAPDHVFMGATTGSVDVDIHSVLVVAGDITQVQHDQYISTLIARGAA